MARIRMLLVDDNLDFRKGVSAWLADEPRIEIAGTACSGREALERVAELKPDLVLMDVSMPEIDGFEATRRMKSDGEAPLIVLMTFYHSETARQEATITVRVSADSTGTDCPSPRIRVRELPQSMLEYLEIYRDGEAR